MYLEVFLIISLCRNFIGDEDCLKPTLTEMKLEPADSDSTELQQSVSLRKVDKVRNLLVLAVLFIHGIHDILEDFPLIKWDFILKFPRR